MNMNIHDGGPHEANFLKLDHSKITTTFGWKPHWHIDKTMSAIIEWTNVWMDGGDIPAIMDRQIQEFLNK